jgi:hypothetical protein
MLGKKKTEDPKPGPDLEIPTGKLKDLGLGPDPKAEPSAPGGIDIEELIQKLEEIGNDYLVEIDPELKYSNKLIKAHSAALAMVLKKYIPSERGPEFYLASLTGVMAVDMYAKLQRIQEKKKKEAAKVAAEQADAEKKKNGGQ